MINIIWPWDSFIKRLHLFLLFPLLSPSIWGGVYLSQEKALDLAFPNAHMVERKHTFLTLPQIDEIQNFSRTKLDSEIVTYYVGISSRGILGYAFFQTHLVRTMPETLMVVVTPEGTVQFVEILAFHEPEDYRPPPKWLRLFHNKELSGKLWVKRSIRNITGATLSVQVITDAVRQSLATFKIIIQEE